MRNFKVVLPQACGQSVTFWCQYRNQDHFGLKNGLETSLITPGSVTFLSQNGLEAGSRPFWSQKRSRDPVSPLSACGMSTVYPEVLRAHGQKSPFFLFCFDIRLGEKSQKTLLKRPFSKS